MSIQILVHFLTRLWGSCCIFVCFLLLSCMSSLYIPLKIPVLQMFLPFHTFLFHFIDCQGPAPAGSRGTLRMNGVSEWGRETKLGLSLKFIFAWPLYTLNNIFGGSAYCLHTGHLKTLQQLDVQQKQDVTHILSFTKVFLIIWPSGLLTFYGLHLVWLKQLQ